MGNEAGRARQNTIETVPHRTDACQPENERAVANFLPMASRTPLRSIPGQFDLPRQNGRQRDYRRQTLRSNGRQLHRNHDFRRRRAVARNVAGKLVNIGHNDRLALDRRRSAYALAQG